MKIMFLAGHSAIGKTEAAKVVSKKLNLAFLAERSILDKVAERRGFSRIRDAIKEIGMETLLKEAREETKNQILKSQNNNMIFDGAYDGELVNFVKKNIPKAEVLVVGISSNKTMRRQRMMKRKGWSMKESLKELRFIDSVKDRMGGYNIARHPDIKIKNKGLFEPFASELEKTAYSFFINKE
ncbi:MAG: AAA family ATPase [Candidatus Marsarchaeota archaeon]|nr:AAA family ATPase [Candidatus Marsarchaeota archaeon]